MDIERLAVTLEELVYEIQKNTEWLETTHQDSVECISIENLEEVLNNVFGIKINISQS